MLNGKLQIREFLLAGTGLLLFACGGGGGKKVYFGNLEDGSNVESPFKVEMKAENLIVEPATLGVNEGHGHFHIVLDASLASPAEPMPKDAKHIHYGDGQTSTILDLPVGQHTLILQFAKGDHVPYDPPVYQQIQINVTKQNAVDTVQAKPADTTAAAATKTAADSAASKLTNDSSAATVKGNAKADSAKTEGQKHEGHKKEK
jgi:uncharacterized protein DUF4399